MNARTTLALLALTGPLAASTVQKATLTTLARDAHVIVDVRIDETRSHVLANGVIVTTYRATVNETLKSDRPHAGTMEFTMVGGTVGDLTLRIPGLPVFRPGQRHVLFLNRPSALGTCVPIGLAQGAYEVVPTEDGKGETVRRHLGTLTIVDPNTGRPVDVPDTQQALTTFKEHVRRELRRTR